MSANPPSNPAPAGRAAHRPFIPRWLDDAGLCSADYRVLCHLWRRADWQTGIAWPSIPTIAQICRLDRKTVIAALRRLESGGHLSRRKHYRNSNEYVLRVPPIVPIDRRIGENGARIDPIGSSIRDVESTQSTQESAKSAHKTAPMARFPIGSVDTPINEVEPAQSAQESAETTHESKQSAYESLETISPSIVPIDAPIRPIESSQLAHESAQTTPLPISPNGTPQRYPIEGASSEGRRALTLTSWPAALSAEATERIAARINRPVK